MRNASAARGGCRMVVSPVLLAALAIGCAAEVVDPPLPQGPANQVPVAAAGADLTVSVGLPVRLDGSASTDPDGDPLIFTWTLTAPTGSGAALSDAGSATPSFVPDVAGTYTAQLAVHDGTDGSSLDAATITAEDNTTTEMIGAGGGDVVSADGIMTLSIPAGALSDDTEIAVTVVPPAQFPDELEGLEPDALLYNLQPDGLAFTTAATATLSLANDTETEPGQLSVAMGTVGVLSNGTLAAIDNQRVAVIQGSGVTVVKGDLSHFSWLLYPTGRRVLISAVIPDQVPQAVEFIVAVTLQTEVGTSVDDAHQVDASVLPVAPRAGFDGTFEFINQQVAGSENTYVCGPPVGFGEFGTVIDLTYRNAASFWDEEPINATVTLRGPVRCQLIVQEITVVPADTEVTVGEQVQYSATGTLDDGSTVNLTSHVTWSSGNVSVATINPSGTATAIGEGSSTIRATFDNGSRSVAGFTRLEVVAPPPAPFVAKLLSNLMATVSVDRATGAIAFGEAVDVNAPAFSRVATDADHVYVLGDGQGTGEDETLAMLSALTPEFGFVSSTEVIPPAGSFNTKTSSLVARDGHVFASVRTGVRGFSFNGAAFTPIPLPSDDVTINQPIQTLLGGSIASGLTLAVVPQTSLAFNTPLAVNLFDLRLNQDAAVHPGSPFDLRIGATSGLFSFFASGSACLYANDFDGNYDAWRVTPGGVVPVAGFPRDIGGMGFPFGTRFVDLSTDLSGSTLEVVVPDATCNPPPPGSGTVLTSIIPDTRVATSRDGTVILIFERAGLVNDRMQAFIMNADGTVTTGPIQGVPFRYFSITPMP